jgi:hypothetical protein
MEDEPNYGWEAARLNGEIGNAVLVDHVIDKISFGHFPMPIELRTYRKTHLHIKIRTSDRRLGYPCYVEGYRPIPAWFQRPADIENIILWIKDEVLSLIKHELDEFMLLDGNRVFDPHKPRLERPKFMPQDLVDDLMRTMTIGKQLPGQGKKP